MNSCTGGAGRPSTSVLVVAGRNSNAASMLAAYFTQATVDSLGIVDDTPVLKNLVVPEDLSKSSRRIAQVSGGKAGSQVARAHSQFYVYGSAFQASTSSSRLYHYRTISPVHSHAPSQFSTSSQSQSSSACDSSAPRPISVRTPFFSWEPPGQLPNDSETKFESVTQTLEPEGIQEHDGTYVQSHRHNNINTYVPHCFPSPTSPFIPLHPPRPENRC